MSSATTLKRPPEKNDHHLGSLDSPIYIVEYGDYECSYCAEAVATLDQVLSENKNICFIFRHFPLTNIHHSAGVAAVASEAAARQGKFWEMHRALFKNQANLDSENIFSIARELGLNMRIFLNDLEEEELFEKVQRDFSSGMESGVDATPALFINGIRFEEDVDIDDIQDELDGILRDLRPRPD